MMRRNHLGLTALMAMGALGSPAAARTEPPPLADDRKPVRIGDRSLNGYWGTPYPGLHHVSRETLNRPAKRGVASPLDEMQAVLKRIERRARRKARMRLRKRRGWR